MNFWGFSNWEWEWRGRVGLVGLKLVFLASFGWWEWRGRVEAFFGFDLCGGSSRVGALFGLYELEPTYADYCRNVLGKKAWHIGPVWLCNRNFKDKAWWGKQSSIDEYECLEWLSSKKPDSVIYICFGTLAEFSSAQLMEIALGIEASGQEFIWVVRKNKKDEDGNEDWNGDTLWLEFKFLKESLLGVGVQEMRNMGVSAKREAIEKALKEIMVGDGAEEKKKRAKGLGLRARRAVEGGGSSSSDLNALIPELIQTDLQSGAQYKNGLLWIILVASCAALIIQSLAANLGIVVGKHLAEHYRNVSYPKVPNFVLWILAEIRMWHT
ncbi:hypothetical protein EZV62_009618 [Acer yangbiense]|uniref:Uncharacterized protein n=1 Tax=Acer yangbiense TaxID=1000413 RepID=A0A5C7I0P9_9ROSI|nr:hypothetical protein EZV62_009618 [Acer yangbiense]